LEEKKRQRKLNQEAKRRRQKEEEEAKQLAEEERLRKEFEYRAEQRLLETHREREAKVQEEREWQARQPVICESCNGTGLCIKCEGKGESSAVFLSSSAPKKEAAFNFGRSCQGCEDCGGCRQNIVGRLQKGNGQCPSCNGKGKVWPSAAFESRTSRARVQRGMSTLAGDFSPKSTMSLTSPKAFA